MEKVRRFVKIVDKSYYILHHVVRESSAATKLRVLFNVPYTNDSGQNV